MGTGLKSKRDWSGFARKALLLTTGVKEARPFPEGAWCRNSFEKHTIGFYNINVLSACHSRGFWISIASGLVLQCFDWLVFASITQHSSLVSYNGHRFLQPCQCFLFSGEFISFPHTSSLPVALRFVGIFLPYLPCFKLGLLKRFVRYPLLLPWYSLAIFPSSLLSSRFQTSTSCFACSLTFSHCTHTHTLSQDFRGNVPRLVQPRSNHTRQATERKWSV